MSEATQSIATSDITGEEPDGPIDLAVADLDSDSVERLLVSPALARALVRAAAVNGSEVEPGLTLGRAVSGAPPRRGARPRRR